jgi:CubicO group peptidase (beta-lactamase class C family)
MKYFGKPLFTVLLIVAFFFSNAQKNPGIDYKKLDAYLESALKSWGIPGMAVAVVEGDKITFAKGYGVREYGKPEKVDSKTLFSVASNTKSFTTGALSLLVEEGKISWDDKVIDYLPWFRLYDPYVTSEMTIRDLVCHRSGLKTFSGDLIWYESNYSRKEVIERAAYLKPEYGFRSQFGYSNIMFAAAGEIIPVVTGMSWEDYIRKAFFTKLGMTSSLLSVSELNLRGNVAIPHHTADSIKPLPIKYMKWDNVAPAAAIISNVEDMSQWLIMQMNEGIYKGDTILDENQLWEMHSPQTSDNSSKAWMNYFPTKHFESYGLGWSLFDYQGYKVVNHGGGADGMISQTMFVPEEDLGIVILTNSINYLPMALMYYIIDDFKGDPITDWSEFYLKVHQYGKSIDKSHDDELNETRVTGTKPSLALEAYTGIYGGELYGDVEVRLEKGHLVLDFVPSETLIGDLYHRHYDTFTIKLRNSPTLPKGTVNFVINADGKPEELKIDIPNPDFDFTELILKKK